MLIIQRLFKKTTYNNKLVQVCEQHITDHIGQLSQFLHPFLLCSDSTLSKPTEKRQRGHPAKKTADKIREAARFLLQRGWPS